MIRSYNFALILCILLFIPYSLFLVNHRPDDVYIYYRYAHNFASGFGVVFNPGERVEGVTSLLWMFFLAAFDRFGFELERWAPLLSLFCACVLLIRLPLISSKLQGSEKIQLSDVIPTLLLATSPSFAYWSYSGMETVPFALVLLLAIEFFLKDSKGAIYLSIALTVAAVLLRPEMLVVIPMFVLYSLVLNRRIEKHLRIWIIGVGCLVSAIFLFRYLYFSELLPNTYYAKHGAPLYFTTRFGSGYFFNLLAGFSPLRASPVLHDVIIGILFSIPLGLGLTNRRLSLCSLCVLSLVAAVIYDGGDWMILNRLLVPIFPLMALLIVIVTKVYFRKSWLVVASCYLVFINIYAGYSACYTEGGQLHPSSFTTPPYSDFISYLNRNFRQGDAIALMDIGEIGYKTPLRVIDISGLTHSRIAKAPGGFLTKVYPVEWVFDEKPRWIALRKDASGIDHRFAVSYLLSRDYQEVLRVDKPSTMVLFERLDTLSEESVVKSN